MKIKILILPLILFCMNIVHQEVNASENNLQQFAENLNDDYAMSLQILQDAESHPNMKITVSKGAITDFRESINAAKILTKDEFRQYKYIFESMLKAFDHAVDKNRETKQFNELKKEIQELLLKQQEMPSGSVAKGTRHNYSSAGTGVGARVNMGAASAAAMDDDRVNDLINNLNYNTKDFFKYNITPVIEHLNSNDPIITVDLLNLKSYIELISELQKDNAVYGHLENLNQLSQALTNFVKVNSMLAGSNSQNRSMIQRAQFHQLSANLNQIILDETNKKSASTSVPLSATAAASFLSASASSSASATTSSPASSSRSSSPQDNAAALASANAKAITLFNSINTEHIGADLSTLDEAARLQVMQIDSQSESGDSGALKTPLAEIIPITNFINDQTCVAVNQSAPNKAIELKRVKARRDALKVSRGFNKIETYRGICNVKGDNSCGFRSFLLGTLITAAESGQYDNIDKLITQINTHYIEFFNTYNRMLFTPEEINASKAYILEKLNDFKKATNYTVVHTQYNNDIPFDVYMILFLRYLAANYIENTVDQEKISGKIISIRMLDTVVGNDSWIEYKDSRNAHNSLQLITDTDYIKELTTWGALESDQFEFTALNNTTLIPITIFKLMQEFPTVLLPHEETRHQIRTEPSIVNTGGHYQVLIP